MSLLVKELRVAKRPGRFAIHRIQGLSSRYVDTVVPKLDQVAWNIGWLPGESY